VDDFGTEAIGISYGMSRQLERDRLDTESMSCVIKLTDLMNLVVGLIIAVEMSSSVNQFN
jgi:hypothetical protein